MKKYTVKDEDGKVVEVTEYEKGEAIGEQPTPAAEPGKKPEAHDEIFSEEQVAEIKRIVTEAITAALHPAEETTQTQTEQVEQTVEDPAKKEEEHLGDACKGKDSVKANPGAIPQKQVKDSVVNDEDEVKKENEINSAWDNRWR